MTLGNSANHGASRPDDQCVANLAQVVRTHAQTDITLGAAMDRNQSPRVV